MISVLDYGMGNIGSVLNMIKKVGGEAEVIRSPEEVLKAKKILLPGVGAFDAGIRSLQESELDKAIKHAAEVGIPILGICLGMQLLLDSSEEGELPGLGIISGRVVRFDQEMFPIKVPHMGWNEIEVTRNSELFRIDDDKHRFYFVHSYYVVCDNEKNITSYATHGNKFVASFEKDNVLGAQFHPEKSHSFGMSLMKRFVEL